MFVGQGDIQEISSTFTEAALEFCDEILRGLPIVPYRMCRSPENVCEPNLGNKQFGFQVLDHPVKSIAEVSTIYKFMQLGSCIPRFFCVSNYEFNSAADTRPDIDIQLVKTIISFDICSVFSKGLVRSMN